MLQRLVRCVAALVTLMILSVVPTASAQVKNSGEEGWWEIKDTTQGVIKWNCVTGESYILTGKENKNWQTLPRDNPVDGWWYNPLVSMKIGEVTFIIELFEDVVPNTVANFISLVEEGFYNKDCSIYRVETTRNFSIVQGGRSPINDHPYSIKNESLNNEKYRLTNNWGTVALARSQNIHSGNTDFYINLRDNLRFDSKDAPYCVFGQVITPVDSLNDIRKDARISDVRVIRKRGRNYVPMVIYSGEDKEVLKR